MKRLSRPITLDEVAAYHTAGVVHLRGVFDLATVNMLRRSIDEAANTIAASKQGYDFSRLTRAMERRDDDVLRGADGGQHEVSAIVEHIRASEQPLLFDADPSERDGRFLVDTAVTTRVPPLRRFAVDGAAGDIAGALLGSEVVRYFGDQMFVKEPGTRERTAFHQDATYFEIDGDQCCVCWIPVDPVSKENGGMVYVRGSHRDGKLYKPNVFVSQTALPGAQGTDLPDIEGRPDDFDLVQFDVEPGDVLVHHYRTLHGAGGNLSRYQVRRALSIRYCGDDIRVTRRPWAPKQLHLTTEMLEGEPLNGPDFPIAWRRQVQRAVA